MPYIAKVAIQFGDVLVHELRFESWNESNKELISSVDASLAAPRLRGGMRHGVEIDGVLQCRFFSILRL
jgi:hypothetical protein